MSRSEFGIYSSTEYELTSSAVSRLTEAAEFVRDSVMSEVASLPEGLPTLEVSSVTQGLSNQDIGAIALGFATHPTELIPAITIKEIGHTQDNYTAVILTNEGLFGANGVLAAKRDSSNNYLHRYLVPELYKRPGAEIKLWLNDGPLVAQKVSELKAKQEQKVA